MSKDVTYHIAKGHLYKDIENDGHTFIRHGAWSYSECLCTIEEAKEKYPDIYERLMRSSNAIRQQTPSV